MHAQRPSSTRYGLVMLALAWLVLLGLGIAAYSGWLDHRAHPNREPQGLLMADGSAQVRLRPSNRHHYYTGARANGRDVMLLVDTGASDVVVPHALARAMALPELGRGVAMTANGRVEVTRTRLDTLDIGPIRLRDVSAIITPGMEGEVILLGMSALHRLHFRNEDGDLILEQSAVP